MTSETSIHSPTGPGFTGRHRWSKFRDPSDKDSETKEPERPKRTTGTKLAEVKLTVIGSSRREIICNRILVSLIVSTCPTFSQMVPSVCVVLHGLVLHDPRLGPSRRLLSSRTLGVPLLSTPFTGLRIRLPPRPRGRASSPLRPTLLVVMTRAEMDVIRVERDYDFNFDYNRTKTFYYLAVS